MFESSRDYTIRLPPHTGGQTGLPSNHLRTLAWMHYLLDHLHEVRDYAFGKETPLSWNKRRKDAVALKARFEEKDTAPVIKADKRERVPSDLDKVFGTVFTETTSFGNKYVQGSARPTASLVEWLNDLVPGSARAFFQPPELLGEDFYDVLDFLNPGFGRLFIWRALDPEFQDGTWDELADKGWVDKRPQGYAISYQALSAMRNTWSLDHEDESTIEGAIKGALARILFGEAIENEEEQRIALDSLHAARAAREAGREKSHPVTERLADKPAGQIFAALVNAIAAYRTVVLLDWQDRWYAGWWLDGVLGAAKPHIAAKELEWFCFLPNKKPPLQGTLEKLDLWNPTPLRPRVDE